VSEPEEPPYDCQTCGACCDNWFGTEEYVYLAPPEAGAMRRLGLPVHERKGKHYLGTRPEPSGPGGRSCAAFVGRVGGPCGCGVYGQRPAECRRFPVGDFECRLARREAGLPT
jgi:Fe-S-cluster containining protein